MKSTLVTVIIPVYNVEDYLEECLESVVNQTYNNIEIIVIDDGSTDKSGEILTKYSNTYNSIKILTQSNKGQSVARNKGINQAQGKYIYFLDADDYIDPETIKDLIHAMEETDVDLIRFGAEPFVDGIEMNLSTNKYDLEDYYTEDKIYDKSEILEINTMKFLPSPVLYILKRELLIENNIYFKPGIIHEDELFTLQVILNTKTMIYNRNFYYKRRYRRDSTMTSTSLKSKYNSFESRCKILEELNSLLINYNYHLEKKLINKRIRFITIMLAYKYDELDKNYKKKKIRNVEGLPRFKYILFSLKNIIKNFLKRILSENRLKENKK